MYDISGNGNHGIIHGATYSDDVPEQNCFSNELSISNDFTFLGSLDSSYYYLSNNFHTWQEAQLICNSLGGDLLTITDEDESDYITSILDINSNTVIVNIGFWIGLQLIDDEWSWVNDEPFVFTNWNLGEPSPDDGSNSEYGQIYTSYGNSVNSNYLTGTWDDRPEELKKYILEIIHLDGCTDSLALNFNSSATEDDGSCIERVYGCLDNDYVEYNDSANTDNGSCDVLLSIAYVEVTQHNINLNNTIDEATTSISSLQQALDTWNTIIDLSTGWNMFIWMP